MDSWVSHLCHGHRPAWSKWAEALTLRNCDFTRVTHRTEHDNTARKLGDNFLFHNHQPALGLLCLAWGHVRDQGVSFSTTLLLDPFPHTFWPHRLEEQPEWGATAGVWGKLPEAQGQGQESAWPPGSGIGPTALWPGQNDVPLWELVAWHTMWLD